MEKARKERVASNANFYEQMLEKVWSYDIACKCSSSRCYWVKVDEIYAKIDQTRTTPNF
jgi:hypothetical protein